MTTTSPLPYHLPEILDAGDILVGCFPPELRDDATVVLKALANMGSITYISAYDVTWQGRTLTIPYRIHHCSDHTDPRRYRRYYRQYSLPGLTETQKTIFDCILLRHFSGFVRHEALKQLLSRSEQWIIPFAFRLLGEYVENILFDMWEHISNNMGNYLAFIKENRAFFKTTERQMVSYHACYYWRTCPRPFYIGYQIFREFKRHIQPFHKSQPPISDWPRNHYR